MRRILPGFALLALAGCGGGGGGTGGNTPDPTPTGAKWTVLVYMNAANDLTTYSTRNVNQMESLAAGSDVNFVVQWKKAKGWWDSKPEFEGTRRYLVKPDSSEAIESQLVQDLGTDVDMGKAETLADFVAWGKRNYPADHTMVVVWDHGTGWQRLGTERKSRYISADFATGSRILSWDLAKGFPSKVDVIATDACLMQMVEVAYQLRNKCDYFVGSEDLVPAEGYPYDKVFAGLKARAASTPETAASSLSTSYAALSYSPYSQWEMQQSAVATAKLPALATALDGLAEALIANKDAVKTIVKDARESSKAYDPRFQRSYLDLIDLAGRLADSTAPKAVKNAAKTLVAAAQAAVATNAVNKLGKGGNGISVDFSPASEFAGTVHETDYASLDLGRDTRWDEWLKVAP